MGPIASLELLKERNCLVPAGERWTVRDHIKGNESVGHIERLASHADVTVCKAGAAVQCVLISYGYCPTGNAPFNYVKGLHCPGTR